MLVFQRIYSISKQAVSLWFESRAATMGAALAYYTLFSLPPLLIFTLAMASLVFGEQAASGQLAAELEKVVGADVAQALQGFVVTDQETGRGPLAMLLGLAVLLFGASGVFGELQASLNAIWQVEPRPGRGIWGILQDRFLSFTFVLGTCFLLLVSLLISAVLAAVAKHFSPQGHAALALLWQGIHAVVAFGVVTFLFALIYRWLPDVQIAWRDVWAGAAVTALLFHLGKYALGLYIAYGNVSSAYGAAGSVIVVAVWVYYTAQIFLLGAAFTRVYAECCGKHEPMRHAVATPGAATFASVKAARAGM